MRTARSRRRRTIRGRVRGSLERAHRGVPVRPPPGRPGHGEQGIHEALAVAARLCQLRGELGGGRGFVQVAAGQGDPRLRVREVGHPERVAVAFELDPRGAGVALGVPEVVDREIRQGQLVLGQPDLGPGVDRPEQGHALDPGPDRALEVARHPVGLGQRVEQGGAAAVVEVRTERACLLEEGDRGSRLTPVRHDRREGDQDADPQLRVRLGSELGEQLLVEHPGTSRVVGRVVAGREPVGRPAGLRRPVRRHEELPRLRREPDHLPALPEPV